ncbi:MAG: 4Fe-4S dicluster domain-containing protein [Acidobacteria bacterium]|nr:4Fe-4S dicluster domain-containing protein [Acidobacteriota bacterium]
MEYEKLTACVHCGLCLSACPTYLELGNENDSPRGRLYLMRAVLEGRLPVAATLKQHIDRCLGCRACETACPSGVRYGLLLEQARAEILRASPARRSSGERLLDFVLQHLFTSPSRLRWLLRPARWIRGAGILQLLSTSTSDDLPFSRQVRKAVSLLRSTAPTPLPARGPGNGSGDPRPASERPRDGARGTVDLFAGCVMRELFSHVNQATVKTLSANGWRVEYRRQQVCCGALHAHAGHRETARVLARKNLDLFMNGDSTTPVIVNAAGCGAMLKQYGELLEDDEHYRTRASRFSARVRDICEFLTVTEFSAGPRNVPVKVSYDAPCHLHHGQGVKTAPLELVRQLPGVTVIPLPGSETCCGSAGIYNLTQPDLADQILSRKLDQIAESQSRLILTGNPGCLMQIASGAEQRGLALQVIHPIELIAAGYP